MMTTLACCTAAKQDSAGTALPFGSEPGGVIDLPPSPFGSFGFTTQSKSDVQDNLSVCSGSGDDDDWDSDSDTSAGFSPVTQPQRQRSTERHQPRSFLKDLPNLSLETLRARLCAPPPQPLPAVPPPAGQRRRARWSRAPPPLRLFPVPERPPRAGASAELNSANWEQDLLTDETLAE
jgi:hypothetical protein